MSDLILIQSNHTGFWRIEGKHNTYALSHIQVYDESIDDDVTMWQMEIRTAEGFFVDFVTSHYPVVTSHYPVESTPIELVKEWLRYQAMEAEHIASRELELAARYELEDERFFAALDAELEG